MRPLNLEQLERRVLLATDLQFVKDINTRPAMVSIHETEAVGQDSYVLISSNERGEIWKFSPLQPEPTLVYEQ